MGEVIDWEVRRKELNRRKALSPIDKALEVKAVIEKENSEKTGILDLAEYKIENLELISHMHWLRELDCSDNQLTSLEAVKSLINLSELDCSWNQLTSLEDIKVLKKITSFNCSGNEITSVEPIRFLTNLTIFNCSNNGIINLDGIKSLINLTALDCGSNQLTSLESIKDLINLNKLSFSLNKLSGLKDIECLTSLKELDCSRNHLSSLEPIKILTNLTKLDCSWNQLTSLEGIQGLTRLTKLDCWDNRITSLEPVKCLTNLNSLNCIDNQISSLEPIKDLINLTMLFCGGNLFTSLSDIKDLINLTEINCDGSLLLGNKIKSLEPIKSLTNLTQLSCCYNQLSSLEPIKGLTSLKDLDCGFNQLNRLESIKGLTSLTKLNCSSNRLTSLEDIKELTSLTKLDCSSNRLISLDGIQGLISLTNLGCYNNQFTSLAPIKELTSLAYLYCSHNQLTSIEFLRDFKELKELSCSNTLIESLDFIKELENLEKLICENCENLNIFPGVLSHKYYDDCLPRLRAFWKEQEGGTEEFEQYKIFVLGNGRVGKTQLSRALYNKGFDESPSTHGIRLDFGNVNIRDDNDENIKVPSMIWDFGGQDIYHSTHSLFFQKSQALFIICWDKESEVLKDHTYDGHEYKNFPIKYWVEYVRKIAPDAPIIIVETKCDNGKRSDYNIQIPANSNEIIHIPFSAIGDKRKQSVRALKNAVEDAILRIRKIYEMPKTYIGMIEDIKNRIGNIHSKSLTQEEFAKLCISHGIKTEAKHMRDVLHASGIIFYQKGLFNDEIILDQQWALNAIYSVFDRENSFFDIKQSRGVFSLDDLQKVWGEYSPSEQKLFLSMMQQCNIAFEYKLNSEGKQLYIAPDLLPEKDEIIIRDINQAWNEEAPECLKPVEFDFLHEGLMRSIICEIGEIAKAGAIFWKNGILFYEGQEQTPCIIEFMPDENSWHGKINVKTQKKNKEELANRVCKFIKERAERQNLAAKEEKQKSRSAEKDEVKLDVNKPEQSPIYTDAWYISYPHGEKDGKELTPEGRVHEGNIEKLYNILKDAGKNVRLDKIDIKTGESILQFMQEMGSSKNIIVIINKKYLKSKYCMYELCKIWEKNKTPEELRKVIYAYVIEDFDIYDLNAKADISKHWHDEQQNFDLSLRAYGVHAFDNLNDYDYNIKNINTNIAQLMRLIEDSNRSQNWPDFFEYIKSVVEK